MSEIKRKTELNFEHAKWKDDESISMNVWMSKRKAKELMLYVMPQIFNDEDEDVRIHLFVKDIKDS